MANQESVVIEPTETYPSEQTTAGTIRQSLDENLCRLHMQIAFLRGVAVGAGITNIDKLLEEIK